MEILKNFGFEPVLYGAQIINFLLLAYVFKKFLYRPILKVLEDREEKIKKGVAAFDKSKQILAQAQGEREQILKTATIEAEKILEATKTEAGALKNKVLQESRTQAQKIIIQARDQAELEMEKMEKQAGLLSLTLSEKILKQIITTLFTQEEQNRILERALTSLEGTKRPGD